METIWFIFVALMITMYVLLDGFDLGAGAVHLFAARNDRERRTIILAIGPVWDGNEVWLIAAGGTLFFAFPTLYASGFSGFYLPLIIVLWLLMIRGLSIELRGHINDPNFPIRPSNLLLGSSGLSREFSSLTELPKRLEQVEDSAASVALQGTIARSGEVLLLTLDAKETA